MGMSSKYSRHTISGAGVLNKFTEILGAPPGGLLLQVDVLPHRHGTQPAARGEMEDLQVLPQLSILALKI